MFRHKYCYYLFFLLKDDADGHHSESGHSPHFGFFAVQTNWPNPTNE